MRTQQGGHLVGSCLARHGSGIRLVSLWWSRQLGSGSWKFNLFFHVHGLTRWSNCRLLSCLWWGFCWSLFGLRKDGNLLRYIAPVLSKHRLGLCGHFIGYFCLFPRILCIYFVASEEPYLRLRQGSEVQKHGPSFLLSIWMTSLSLCLSHFP